MQNCSNRVVAQSVLFFFSIPGVGPHSVTRLTHLHRTDYWESLLWQPWDHMTDVSSERPPICIRHSINCFVPPRRLTKCIRLVSSPSKVLSSLLTLQIDIKSWKHSVISPPFFFFFFRFHLFSGVIKIWMIVDHCFLFHDIFAPFSHEKKYVMKNNLLQIKIEKLKS